jgi:cytochrome c553
MIATLLLAGTPLFALAADLPDWAYPVTPPRGALDNVILKQVPGSTKQYTQAQIDDGFNPPDWFPDQHPPMPPVVAHGKRPAARACALCHLTNGAGHPESSSLAGLNAQYFVRQMEEFKAKRRIGIRAAVMNEIAAAISDDEVKAAADYFAALKPTVNTKVVETDTVPKTYVGAGAMRFEVKGPDAGREPIGSRIIVVPEDEPRAHMRDPHSGFIDYVPLGSIKRGEALAKTGAGKTTPCVTCHGWTLKGLNEWPALAGRPPTYLVRQLHDMQTGARSGPAVALMKPVVENLSMDDMIALAAYLGSLTP